ncbi:MAG: RNA polymerase sigma factor [Myxococcota bacterium]
MNAPTDAELLDATARGDRAAYGTLVRRHHASILRYARAIAGDAAEDVVQQAFLDGLRGAATYRGGAAVRTWLFTLTRNAAYRSRRLRVGEPRTHVPLDAVAEQAGWGADPETALAQQLDAARLRAALATLSPDAQEILVLRDMEGIPGAETAVLLKLSLPAMKSRLHRARLELAAAVRKEFGYGS